MPSDLIWIEHFREAIISIHFSQKRKKSNLRLSKHLLQMPHTWGGSDPDPAAVEAPFLLPTFGPVAEVFVLVDFVIPVGLLGLC